MSFAAIDLGTNSVKLLIGDVADGKVVPDLHRIQITRLGEGLQASGAISPEAADRTLKALLEFRALAEERNVTRTAVVGTQALRTAGNADEFLRRCQEQAGLAVRILAGDEEAKLAFQGAASAAASPRIAAVDIGGGSTELMLGSRGGLDRAWSLSLGAVTLTEQFIKTDPPSEEEMHLMSAAIHRQVRTVDLVAGPQAELVGIGGTVSSLLQLLRKQSEADARAHPRQLIPYDAISAMAIHLSLRTTAERESMGLERGRADIIVAGAWILTAAMSHLGASSLRASTQGLRHGLLLELAAGRWP